MKSIEIIKSLKSLIYFEKMELNTLFCFFIRNKPTK